MNKTLEGINSRITEAEVWVSDPEDKMVEIIATKQNIKKRMKKKLRQPKRPLGQHKMHQHSYYRGPRRRRKDQRKYLMR